MSNVLKAGAALAGLAIGAQAHAAQIAMGNSPSSSGAVLSGLVALDLTGLGIAGLSGAGNNEFHSFYDDGLVTGWVRSKVYGNVSTPGITLNTVLITYEFEAQGISPIDEFAIGINSSINIDQADILGATKGDLTDLSTVTSSPNTWYNDNAPLADNVQFAFGGLDGVGDTMEFGEFYGYYMLTDGAVQIGLVNGEVRNFGATEFQALAFVAVPGQPDLDAPTPGAALILGGAGLVAAGRRRR